MDSHDKMPPPEDSNIITADPEKHSAAEIQVKDFKIENRNVLKELRKDITKFLKFLNDIC